MDLGTPQETKIHAKLTFFVSFLCHDIGDKHNTCGFPSYSEAIAGCSTFVTI